MIDIYKNSHRKTYLVGGESEGSEELMEAAMKHFHKAKDQIVVRIAYVKDDALFFDDLDRFDCIAWVAFTK